MELPIVEFPTYVREMSQMFERVFKQKRTRNQFMRLMTGFVMADKHTIAHMNGLFVFHTNQCNLNRFVTNSQWKIEDINKKKIELIAANEKDGFVVIDDYIVEKYGKNMFGVGWQYDHCKDKKVWGIRIADCVFSGNGIYPLLSTVYLKKKSKEVVSGEHKFRTKIDIQKGHLKDLSDMGLNFSCVIGDSWYFSNKLVTFIRSIGKDWIFACKSNRRILVKRKQTKREWIRVDKFAEEIKKDDFKQIILNNKKYRMKALTVRMKGIGIVRLLISIDEKGNTNFYASNRVDWDEESIAQRYSRRWDIEVWHKEGMGMYGLKECQLRHYEGVSKYLALSALADTLLDISSMHSQLYATLMKQGRTPAVKHRWILVELVSRFVSFAQKIRDSEMKQVIEGILSPYNSTIKKCRNS